MTDHKGNDMTDDLLLTKDMTEGRSIDNALPCPFCGQFPEVEPWHGGGPRKHMVSCTNDDCHCGPATTGNTKKQAIDRWNVRAK